MTAQVYSCHLTDIPLKRFITTFNYHKVQTMQVVTSINTDK